MSLLANLAKWKDNFVVRMKFIQAEKEKKTSDDRLSECVI